MPGMSITRLSNQFISSLWLLFMLPSVNWPNTKVLRHWSVSGIWLNPTLNHSKGCTVILNNLKYFHLCKKSLTELCFTNLCIAWRWTPPPQRECPHAILVLSFTLGHCILLPSLFILTLSLVLLYFLLAPLIPFFFWILAPCCWIYGILSPLFFFIFFIFTFLISQPNRTWHNVAREEHLPPRYKLT